MLFGAQELELSVTVTYCTQVPPPAEPFASLYSYSSTPAFDGVTLNEVPHCPEAPSPEKEALQHVPLYPETVNVKLSPRLMALGLTEHEKLSGCVRSIAVAVGQVTVFDAFSLLVTTTLGVTASPLAENDAVAVLLEPVAPVHL